MDEPTPDRRGSFHTLGDDPIPRFVEAFAGGRQAELVWRNELGGLTFRVGDHFVKWNPRRTGIDLELERMRLEWLAGRHPSPRVVASGSDDQAQWLVTVALPGERAVGDSWRDRPANAIRAIAEGLRALHSIRVDEFPSVWIADSWVSRTPTSIGLRPRIDEVVLVHGDACAPNTLISPDGRWRGNVDFGALTVGDRWADLAIASMSLDWNFGEGHQSQFYDAYEIEPDEEKIHYYRALWHIES